MNEQFTTASEAVDLMQSLGDERQAKELMRFFKTAPGEYGHGDRFLGLKVPATRAVAKRCTALPLNEVATLLDSPWHEVRLCGLLTLVAQYEALCSRRRLDDDAAIERRDAMVQFYLDHARRANNWDLVDLSVYKIVGRWLMTPSRWTDERKLAALRYAVRHLHHPHDLMQKAVGWLLREMGKRVSPDVLRDFLAEHAHHMPRTALRYAIEHMDADERKFWMKK